MSDSWSSRGDEPVTAATAAAAQLVGWREWLSLPQIGIDRIKAKVDTGARTSALHTCFVEPYDNGGQKWLRFGVHPLQRRSEPMVVCTAPVVDRRVVADSGGHRQQRWVIATELHFAGLIRTIELTLTERDSMRFRMLLGRTALEGLFLVDPARSYLMGRPARRRREKLS